MVQYGNHITASLDPLEKILPLRFYHALINPKPEIDAIIRQLRILRSLNYKQYNEVKKQLPYIVCGIFNPPLRRLSNFGYIEYFIIDIDNLSEKGIDIINLKERLSAEESVFMLFLSPGEDGLKVMFRLQERCYDASLYSLFYHEFVKKFSNIHGLEQVIDQRTSDATRACFVSVDPQAYLNENAVPIALSSYVDMDNLFHVQSLQRELINEEISERRQESHIKKEEIADEALQFIRSKLNPRHTVSENRTVYVPQQLDEIMKSLAEYLVEAQIELYQIENIQYGKKLRMRVEGRLAEINLFYGKKGYSVVQSPRVGTSAELNQLCRDYIFQFVNML